ncbi:low molecular weight phosphatase family protein [Parvularcula sp. IMCC14364]|uniref:arsenate-mycothiol transferase ArsC n=1 Tax=Parvularcula sp. IMCC14364 TaxID=3067902 RepID=UPI00274175E1|nr:low molecular weight phosphatase family protein [Parvularcula sp. IMCC14364]
MSEAAKTSRDQALPRGILFACNMNSVRSPMAEALARQLLGPSVYIASAGVYEGGLDPFVEAIMQEIDHSVDGHEPQEFAAVDPLDFDLVVALTPKAAEEALKFFDQKQIELWETPNPTDVRGSRDQIMQAYREARDSLQSRIVSRFSLQAVS